MGEAAVTWVSAREALETVGGSLAEGGITELRTAFPRGLLALHPIVRALGFREMSIAEHQKLGFAGAGTSLWTAIRLPPVSSSADSAPTPASSISIRRWITCGGLKRYLLPNSQFFARRPLR